MKIASFTNHYPPYPCGVGDYTAKLNQTLQKLKVDINTKINTFKLDISQTEIIHFQYEPGEFNGSMKQCFFPIKAKLKGFKVVVTLHTAGGPILPTISFWPLKKIASLSSFNLMLLFVDKIILTNQLDQQRLAKRVLPFFKSIIIDKTVIIPIGSAIDVYPISKSEKALLINKHRLGKRINLIYFGLITPQKGLESTLQAFSYLDQNKYNLIIVGGVPDSAKEFQDNLKQHYSSLKNVIWTGYQDVKNTSKYLQLADFFVLPFPGGINFRRSSLLAALAHQKPIISTANTSISSDNFKDLPLYLIPTEDPKLIAEKINEITQKPIVTDQRKQKIALSRFEWETIAKNHLDLYKSL